MWRFLDFVVTHRPSIFLLLQPFIEFKVSFRTSYTYKLQFCVQGDMFLLLKYMYHTCFKHLDRQAEQTV